jgi:hypothetical protein
VGGEFKDFDVVVRTPLRRMPMIPLRRRRMPMIPPRRRMLMIPLRRMLMVSKFPLSYRSCSVRSRLGHVNTVNSSLHKTYHLMQNWKSELESWGWWHVELFHGDRKEEAHQSTRAGRLLTHRPFNLKERERAEIASKCGKAVKETANGSIS